MSTLNNISIVTALENLMKAAADWSDRGNISAALKDAVDALGYDPLNPIHNYTVSLEIEFEATSPEDAVRQYRELVETDRSDWVYTVRDEDNNRLEVDTYRWDNKKTLY